MAGQLPHTEGVPISRVAWVALAGIALGLAVGRFAAALPRAAAAPARKPSAASPLSQSGEGASPRATGAATETLTRLRGTRDALLQEISTLEAALPHPRTPEERAALAARFADVVRRIEDGDRAAGLDLMKLRRLLEPADAEALRGELGREQEQHVRDALISGILGCGGPDGAEFLLEALEGRTGAPGDREAVLRFLIGSEWTWADLSVLPVGGDLLETARRMSESTSFEDRAAAATLLGISARADDLETLRRMADTDSILLVRTGAIAGLGLSGNPAALRWLEEDFLPRLQGFQGRGKALLQYEAQDAVKRLKERLGR